MEGEVVEYPFVQVVWWDAEDYRSSWGSEDDAIEFGKRPCEVVSYGYLVSKSKHYVVIAADRILLQEGEVATFGRITKIPRPWVRSLKKIRARKKVRR